MKTTFTRCAPAASQMLALALFASLALAATRAVAGAPSYSITDLGTLGGQASTSTATGINDNTQIAGYATVSGNSQHATLYSNGQMMDLKTDFVAGYYEITLPPGETMVAVKVIDMLGEEVIATQSV